MGELTLLEMKTLQLSLIERSLELRTFGSISEYLGLKIYREKLAEEISEIKREQIEYACNG